MDVASPSDLFEKMLMTDVLEWDMDVLLGQREGQRRRGCLCQWT